MLKTQHPFPRFRQIAQPSRIDGQQQIGQSHPKSDKQENQKGHPAGLGEGKRGGGSEKRRGAGCGDDRGEDSGFAWLDRLLNDSGSGLDLPAAAIVECVQGEGGINVASPDWLRGLARRCQEHGILLIVDDVQMGCGRTGPFFSFEVAGITPDIVCLSKSIGGYGLPLALTLLRPGLDIWAPGEHSGTFRGFDPALITGAAALRAYWSDSRLEKRTAANGEIVAAALADIADGVPGASTRGRGLVHGLEFGQPGMAQKVAAAAFDLGMLVETAGSADQVVKLMPPLTIGYDELSFGLSLLAKAVTCIAM